MGLSTQESGSIGIAIILVIAVVDLLDSTIIVIAAVDVTYALAAILVAGMVGVLVWGFKPRMTRPDATPLWHPKIDKNNRPPHPEGKMQRKTMLSVCISKFESTFKDHICKIEEE